MRRFLITVLLFAISAMSMSAQASLAPLTERLARETMSLAYSFEYKTDVAVTGKGTAALSGTSYFMDANGMEMWCDGKTRWTVDSAAKELYIESVEQIEEEGNDFISNPVLFILHADELFTVSKTRQTTLRGENVLAFDLVPADGGDQVKSASLFVKSSSDLSPKGARIVFADGAVMTLRFSDLKWSGAKKDCSFDVSSLDASYVVTDLR